MIHDWIVPDWPAPANVRAFVTTRAGGVSDGAYASMNLGASSGDDPARVERNREILKSVLPQAPTWLAQVHGVDVADLDGPLPMDSPRADASVTGTRRRVCTVLTADCMPLFLCDGEGRRVAVAHAGWRGLSAGVRRVFGGDFCTYNETGRFFSYRRVQRSGRMGAFIWIE